MTIRNHQSAIFVTRIMSKIEDQVYWLQDERGEGRGLAPLSLGVCAKSSQSCNSISLPLCIKEGVTPTKAL